MKNKRVAEHYKWGKNCDGWHLVQGGSLSVIEERVPPGESEVRHFHRQARQVFYILKGSATMVVEDQVISLSAGDSLEIPPLTPHQFRNDSAAPVEFLVISSPPSHDDREDIIYSK